MTTPDIYYEQVQPPDALVDYVESFWMLRNASNYEKEITVLPDGRVDLFLTSSSTEAFHILLIGLETQPSPTVLAPETVIFAISFKLLAVEYILHTHISTILDGAKQLPTDFLGFNADDLRRYDTFCTKASDILKEQVKKDLDSRKRKLFDLIYSSQGSLSVHQLSDQVFWSRRQINRYFSKQFGISLKSYCDILRFRASFSHLKKGKLFPELNFTDQSHFIREVKKRAGVIPKELAKNKNDRFIQFSTLPKK